jgi:hypothetical protein
MEGSGQLQATSVFIAEERNAVTHWVDLSAVLDAVVKKSSNIRAENRMLVVYFVTCLIGICTDFLSVMTEVVLV